jgi:phytoene synthase
MTTNIDINFHFNQRISYEQIQSNPILDIAAKFWDEERYNAFKILYRTFRIIDDLVDDNKSKYQNLPLFKKQQLIIKVDDWIKTMTKDYSNDPFLNKVIMNINRYQIPLWPWKRFSKSMIFDLQNNGFKTFSIFLKYAEGAAIAPASIFIHLCGLSKNNGNYKTPIFNIRDFARPAALFAYIVHIIRDFQKDQLNNLNYFALDLMLENNVTPRMIKNIALGESVTKEFRNLIRKYYYIADYYRIKTEKILKNLNIYMEPNYRLSLEILYNLYMQIFEKIDIENGKFTTKELNPSNLEIKNRIELVISKFY